MMSSAAATSTPADSVPLDVIKGRYRVYYGSPRGSWGFEWSLYGMVVVKEDGSVCVTKGTTSESYQDAGVWKVSSECEHLYIFELSTRRKEEDSISRFCFLHPNATIGPKCDGFCVDEVHTFLRDNDLHQATMLNGNLPKPVMYSRVYMMGAAGPCIGWPW
eukprot:GFYU01002767.1.p1 GENE.GFYU01002767.1~~GFYU01002767.1.p1  ORF type:complete len:161 (-),score=20.62 GFYU01002767.1:160-642(-)